MSEAAEGGARYPSSGGLLEYVAKGFGDGHFTGTSAWLIYFVNAIVTAMVAVPFGSYASSAVAGENAAWAKVFAVLIILLMTGVNIVGSQLVARARTVVVYVVLGIVFTTLIHEPASIVMLLAILVLSIGLDYWWKRSRTGKAGDAQVAH